MRKVWLKEDGYFITYCETCGCKKKNKKRPYGIKYCTPCGVKIGGKLTSGKTDYSSKLRNEKISNSKKEWWASQDKSILDEWLSDYRGSDKHINMCKSNQKKATKAALGRKQSKPEIEFENKLKSEGINYKTQHYVGGYPFDFYLPDVNLLIEIDGEFYHPLTEEECIYDMQKHNFERDKKKTKVALDMGYNLKRIRV